MLRTDLTLDWWWLYLQVTILAVIIIRELIRPRHRNLFAILIAGTMLVLVQGQTWWMVSKFEQGSADQITQLLHTISLDGARRANFYIGLSTICLGLTYALIGQRKRPAIAREPMQAPFRATPALSSMIVAGWTLGTGAILLASAGGLQAAVTHPGLAFVGGSTMLLILTSLGKLPLLRKVVLRQKLRLLDLLLFVFALFLTLINSRFLAAFIVLQLAVLINYCWREVSRRTLFGLAVVMFLIFIVFGLYRHYTTFTHGVVDLGELQQYLMTRMGPDNPVEWFYSLNIEGFTGLAGLLTNEAKQGGIQFGFGLSEFRVIFQFIPYSVRLDPSLPFRAMTEFLASLYPYHNSIVPSGVENAYGDFGLLGIVGWGMLLGYLARWLHVQMLSLKSDRLQVGLLSVYSLELIRGAFFDTLFFGLSQIIMLLIYRVILAMTKSQHPSRVSIPKTPSSLEVTGTRK